MSRAVAIGAWAGAAVAVLDGVLARGSYAGAGERFAVYAAIACLLVAAGALAGAWFGLALRLASANGNGRRSVALGGPAAPARPPRPPPPPRPPRAPARAPARPPPPPPPPPPAPRAPPPALTPADARPPAPPGAGAPPPPGTGEPLSPAVDALAARGV